MKNELFLMKIKAIFKKAAHLILGKM